MQALRDAMSQLQARNAVVFGVSADTVESHKQFADKEKLNFPLLADPDLTMIDAYGARIPKTKFANRFTFVIGPDGKIEGIDKNVNQQFERGQGSFTSEHGMKLALALTDWKAKLGTAVPYFHLANFDGKTVGFNAGKKATVIVFLGAKDPVSADYTERISIMQSNPSFKDVAFLGIDPNRGETAEQVKQFATGRQMTFSVALDPGGKISDRFGVTVTPTVWVLDAKGVPVYHGAVDDNRDGGKVNARYLWDAVTAVVEGKPVAVAETKATGSPVRRAKRK